MNKVDDKEFNLQRFLRSNGFKESEPMGDTISFTKENKKVIFHYFDLENCKKKDWLFYQTINISEDINTMAKSKKPLMWYLHKALCETGWKVRNTFGWNMYYYHLNKCCKIGFNLYGEKI